MSSSSHRIVACLRRHAPIGMRVLAVSTGVGAAVLAVDLTVAPAFASPTAPAVHHPVPHVTAQPAPMLPPPPQTPILLAVPPSTAAPHIPLVPGADDIPSVVLTAYERAAQAERTLNPGCRLPWQLIAAIGYIESGNGQIGGDTVTAQGEERSAIEGIPLDGSNGIALISDGKGGFARAEGPMQFIPSTWTTWGADGNGDGRKDVQNVFDATLAAAQYLCADSYDLGAPPNQPAAIMRYNHSPIYVKNVMNVEAAYAAGLSAATVKLIPMPGPKCPPGPPGKPRKHRPGCGRPHHAKAHRAPVAQPTLTVVAARSGSSTTPSPKPSPSPTPTTIVATPTPTPTPSASPTPTASPTP